MWDVDLARNELLLIDCWRADRETWKQCKMGQVAMEGIFGFLFLVHIVEKNR